MQSVSPEDPAAGGGARRPRHRLLWAAFGVFSGVVVLAILMLGEGTLVLLLDHPPNISIVRRALAAYYTDFDRAIVQFDPACAEYDRELGYRLKPGSCRFSNREFDTRIDVNSAGLRDREADLRTPRVITLGDSYAMGWGVEAEASFPELLGEICGTSVLNAGISSYGTAREARLLSGLDRSRLDWLIVQYSDNDARENFEFHQRGDRLVPMSEADYRNFQAQMARRSSYFPGKHLVQFIGMLGARLWPQTATPATAATIATDLRSEARMFLHALSQATVPQGVRVIVFELNEHTRNDGRFAAEVRRELASSSYLEPWRSMIVADPAARLGDDDFMILDGHLSPSGHRKVALELAGTMRCAALGTAGAATN